VSSGKANFVELGDEPKYPVIEVLDENLDLIEPGDAEDALDEEADDFDEDLGAELDDPNSDPYDDEEEDDDSAGCDEEDE